MSGLISILSRSTLPIFVALCLILGGASAAGFIANAFLQLLALAILMVAFWRPVAISSSANAPFDAKLLIWAFAIAVGWIAIQLIPLPPAIWHMLPGRDIVASDDAMMGMSDQWRAISLQPSKTIISMVGLLPPLAVLVLTLRAKEPTRITTLWTILGIAVLSSLIGLMQLYQGLSGPAYFYRITNYGTSVGFFANSNHLATLFLIAFVLACEMPFKGATKRPSGTAVWQIIRAVIFLFFVVNIVLNQSIAGYGLLVAAIAYWVLRSTKIRKVFQPSPVVLAVTMAGVAAVAMASIWMLSNRLSALVNNSLSGEERLDYAVHTMRMIANSFPFGNGLGTFRWVYAGIEPLNGVTEVYVNHAHNDYLEFVADFGLVGLGLIAMFFIWFVRRVHWMAVTRVAYPSYCIAAAAGIALVALHSIVDYPLRTAAIGSVFAFLAASLARPIADGDLNRKKHRRRRSRSKTT